MICSRGLLAKTNTRWLTFVFGLALALSVSAGETIPADNMANLSSPPEGWKISEPARTADGRQLFTVINGGAELYVQLGFKQAVFVSYLSSAGIDLNIEIYEMNTPQAALDVYGRKIGGQGKAVKIGEGGLLEDYYLNFVKGSYQVTISGYDSDRQTVAGILMIAKEIDRRLGSS